MDAVTAAFAAVPRSRFLRRAERGQSAYDGPLPIGHGQTNSQPRTVEDMLRLLDVRPGDQVLDVGAGSGWTTALLAQLVGPAGSVLGVELEPDLVGFGSANLAATGQGWARIVAAVPGSLGWPDEAPYHRILVSAAARSLPEELIGQMVADPDDPGRMVIPVAGEMLLVVRTGDGQDAVTVSRHGYYRFVPLR